MEMITDIIKITNKLNLCYILLLIILCLLQNTTALHSLMPLLPHNWIIHCHNWSLIFCIFLVTQETQTQLLLCPGGVKWSEAASGCCALWGWISAAFCPGEGGNCKDTQPWPWANQGALPGHPQAGAEWPEGRNEWITMVVWQYGCYLNTDVNKKEKRKATWLMEYDIFLC